jgi:hypothetical protein
MAVELGSVSLSALSDVVVRERARLARHAVPGLAGDLAQTLGRPSVAVELRGICYGPTASDDLKKLRGVHLDQKPVDFFADAVGEGYFAQVLIARLDVRQRAAIPDQFDFVCEVLEYVEPPQPAAPSVLGGIDASLLDEAAGAMDAAQNAINAVSKLADLAKSVPSFGDPTSALSSMPTKYEGLVSGNALSALTGLRDLF